MTSGQIEEMNHQQMLLEQQGIPKAWLEDLPYILWMKNLEGHYIFANHAYLKMLGKPSECIIGMKDEDVFEEEIAKRHQKDDLEVIKSKAKLYAEDSLINHEGAVISIETFKCPIMDQEGTVIGILGISKDITRRKTLEHELYNQKRFLKWMMDAIPDLVFFKDVSRVYLGCNAAFAENFIGMPEDEIIGKSDFDFMKDQDTAAFFVELDNEVLLTGDPKRNEGTIEMLNAARIQIETIETPFRDESGEIAGIIGIARDITSRKAMEEELRESERRLHLATTGGKIGLWDWSIQTGKTIFNESWANIIGYTLEELEPISIQTWLQFAHPEDLEKSNDLLNKCFNKTLDYYEIEARMKHKNGSWIWVLDRGNVIEWDNDGKPLRMVGTHIDITDRKNVEEELNKKERILSAVALSIKELIDNRDYFSAISYCFDILGKATMVDRVYLFMNQYDEEGNGTTSQKIEWNSGYSEPQIDNPELMDIPFEEIESFIGPLLKREAYYGIVSQMADEKIRTLLESQNILSIVVLPIYVKEQFWGWVGFDECKYPREWSIAEFSTLGAFVHSLEKTIERSMIEKELELSRENAEAANALKSQFLANMSHEIRTPMNAILGYTALLKDLIEGEKEQSFLNNVERAGNALVNLINDILDISKIEAGKMELQVEPVNIHDLFFEIKDLFSLKTYEKRLVFKVTLDPHVPQVLMLDEVRTRQILFNLVGNAVKFTEQGSVELSAQIQNYSQDRGQLDLVFSIKDTGIGISDLQQDTIFEPFKQTDGQSTKKYGGTGLGLSISKRLVEMMGGNIWVESTLGQGTQFMVLIPNIYIGEGLHKNLQMDDEKGYSDSEVLNRKDLSVEKDSVATLEGLNSGLDPELVGHLKALYEGLWQLCSKSNKASDLRDFSGQLDALSQQFHQVELNRYAKELLMSVNAYNAKKTRELLGLYASMMEQLSADQPLDHQ